MSINAADWAQIVIATGTLVAAGVAAYSANVAWKHVRLQFQPRLIIGNSYFQIKMSQESLYDFWWEVPSDKARYSNGGETNYSFKIINIGNGPAYGVRISTEFDYESVFADLKRKLEPFVTGLELTYDEWGCQVSVHGKHRGGFRLPGEASGFIEHIEGASTGRQIAPFLIDPSLSFFALCYAYFLMKGSGKIEAAQLNQLVQLTFVVEYTNQAGRRVRERHPRELIVTGGRWRPDFSDGVAMISLVSRTH
ncbi:MAG: hypothetical protein WBR13_01565 [Allosphingosinicella sp.]